MRISLNVNWNSLAVDWAFLDNDVLEGYLESIAERVNDQGPIKLEGIIRNRKPHGNVTLFMNGGAVQFWCEDGVPSQHMKITFQHGYIFEGIVPCGSGTLTFPNGLRYVGDMSHCRPNGEGTFYVKDGGYVKGNWKDGYMDGIMTLVEVDGSESILDLTDSHN